MVFEILLLEQLIYLTTSWSNQIFLLTIYHSENYSVMSNSLQPHGLYNSWNSPGQNTAVGSLSLLQGIFPTQGSPTLQEDSLPAEPQGKPHIINIYPPISKKVLVAQSCLILCNSVDCSQPSSSVNGILQARILEWVASPFSRGSSHPRDGTQVSCIGTVFWQLTCLKLV